MTRNDHECDNDNDDRTRNQMKIINMQIDIRRYDDEKTRNENDEKKNHFIVIVTT